MLNVSRMPICHCSLPPLPAADLICHCSLPQADPDDLKPMVTFKTTRRAFNAIYERWCNQNQLHMLEVSRQAGRQAAIKGSSSIGCCHSLEAQKYHMIVQGLMKGLRVLFKLRLTAKTLCSLQLILLLLHFVYESPLHCAGSVIHSDPFSVLLLPYLLLPYDNMRRLLTSPSSLPT